MTSALLLFTPPYSPQFKLSGSDENHEVAVKKQKLLTTSARKYV